MRYRVGGWVKNGRFWRYVIMQCPLGPVWWWRPWLTWECIRKLMCEECGNVCHCGKKSRFFLEKLGMKAVWKSRECKLMCRVENVSYCVKKLWMYAIAGRSRDFFLEKLGMKAVWKSRECKLMCRVENVSYCVKKLWMYAIAGRSRDFFFGEVGDESCVKKSGM